LGNFEKNMFKILKVMLFNQGIIEEKFKVNNVTFKDLINNRFDEFSK